MDTVNKPSLTEPGVMYFLKETLKQCNEKKTVFYNTVLNLGFLFIFISVLGILLAYKRKNKPTKEEIQKKNKEAQQYMLERIKAFREKVQRENNEVITTLPRFESNFVRMHKNYYNI